MLYIAEWVLSMDKIKTLIISTNGAHSEHLAYAISRSKRIKLIDIITNGYNGVLEASLLKPDIIIISHDLETKASGVLAANALIHHVPSLKIIMTYNNLEEKTKPLLLSMGIYDILSEGAGIDEIIDSIYNVHSMNAPNHEYISSNYNRRNLYVNGAKDSLMYTLNIVSQLRPKELGTIKLLVDNLSFEEIANIKNSDVESVIKETNTILKKFDKKTTNELIQVLHELNIIEFLDNII